VNPDIAVFRKSLGNRHAITAIIGSEKIMKFSKASFISSTFWSERSGYVAALKTLEIMKKTWLLITKKGIQIREKWQRLAEKYNLDIEIRNIPVISVFDFKNKESKKYITFITQEMLKKDYLANNMVYVSVEHSEKVLKRYYDILDGCFRKISLCEAKKLNIKNLLITTIFKESFTRLN
jgi:glutamate-1-semialdehyde 2,1-aminomutase